VPHYSIACKVLTAATKIMLESPFDKPSLMPAHCKGVRELVCSSNEAMRPWKQVRCHLKASNTERKQAGKGYSNERLLSQLVTQGWRVGAGTRESGADR
jgi:hypothetical protein